MTVLRDAHGRFVSRRQLEMASIAMLHAFGWVELARAEGRWIPSEDFLRGQEERLRAASKRQRLIDRAVREEAQHLAAVRRKGLREAYALIEWMSDNGGCWQIQEAVGYRFSQLWRGA